ncbi:MAG: TonB-dependent receptor [Acidovorax sp.]|jgi:outer membrane receptor for ferric coprogen and ferric-rhodotorulic acid|nr:TonB-dependent receptor [Acidovorax sp.]
MVSQSSASFPLHPISQAGLAVLMAVGLVVAASPGMARAQPVMQAQAAASAPRQFLVPPGPLAQALTAFAADAGVSVSAPPALVQGKRTAGLQGRYTVREALERLLAGSDLQAEAAGQGSYVLRAVAEVLPAGAAAGATLAEVRVQAQAERSGITEDTGSYTQTGPSRTATGLALSLRETPQSVSVMTRQRMDDFKLETLTDVMEQTPGLFVDHQGDANNFFVRGENVNLQVDGMRQMAGGWAVDTHKQYSMDDMVEIDRIEVLKGSSGLMNGDGKYGATVNMVRKRPTHEFKASVGASAGSWGNYRTDADLGGPLNASGTVRGRIVAAAADGKDFRDNVKRKNQTLFGTLDVDLTSDTLLNVGFIYRHREYYGAGDTAMIQAYAANGQYLGLRPRSFNVAAPWSGYEQDAHTLFANLEHRFGGGWTAKLRASEEQTKNPYAESGYWWTAVPEAVDVSWTRDYTNRNRGLALEVQGPFQLFGRSHEVMFGADFARTRSDAHSGSDRLSNLGLDYANGGGAIVRPDLDSYPEDNHSHFSSKRSSFYATGRFSLADPLKLITGARITNYQQYDLTPYAWSNNDYKKNGVITPYAGLVLDMHENVSLYGSYASIFKPQSAIDAQGRMLDPEEGQTYEVGAKGEFFDKRLNASIAHFWMKTDNVAELTGDQMPDGTSIYRSVSGVSRHGYELELSGELARGWQAQGGYVMNSSSLSSASYLPKNQFKLGTTYQFGGALGGLTAGVSTRWQSKTSAGALEQPAFWVVDLMARYRVNQHLSLSLNVRNAFDKSYFASMRDAGRIQYTWGAPRSVNVGMRYDF